MIVKLDVDEVSDVLELVGPGVQGSSNFLVALADVACIQVGVEHHHCLSPHLYLRVQHSFVGGAVAANSILKRLELLLHNGKST